MSINIVGGGIAGLTTAIALKQKGFAVQIFEQAPALKSVGAGIILANNAMQIFNQLGLQTAIQSRGHIISQINLTDSALKVRQTSDLSAFERYHGAQNIALHRADLQTILSKQIDDNELFLEHELHRVSNTPEGYRLHFKNHYSAISKMLIGADGIHSSVRAKLFGQITLRDAKQTCWRGVTEFTLPQSLQNTLTEAWGHATRFGIVPIGNGRVYWYALKSNHIHSNDLSILFNDYSAVVKDLINATAPQHIHLASIKDFKPIKAWTNGQACLLGDAAHAMTPNLGQGACQGIEDAYVLSECLSRYPLEQALSEYQRLRMPKATQISNVSWQFGQMAHQTNPVIVAIRNKLLRLTPNFIQQRMLANTFKIEMFS